MYKQQLVLSWSFLYSLAYSHFRNDHPWDKIRQLYQFCYLLTLLCLKCIWHEIFFLLIWKAFWNTEEWRFSFWNIFFSFQRYWHFSIMQISSVMTSFGLQLKTGKYLINNISKTIEAVLLKLGTTNVHHKRNKMTPLKLLPWQQFCRWCYLNKNWNSQVLS